MTCIHHYDIIKSIFTALKIEECFLFHFVPGIQLPNNNFVEKEEEEKKGEEKEIEVQVGQEVPEPGHKFQTLSTAVVLKIPRASSMRLT